MLSNKIFAKAIISLLIATPLCYAAAEPQAATLQTEIERLQALNSYLREGLIWKQDTLQRIISKPPSAQDTHLKKILEEEIVADQGKIIKNVSLIEELQKSLQKAAKVRPTKTTRLLQLTDSQTEAAMHIAEAIFQNQAQTVENIFNYAFKKDILTQDLETALALMNSLNDLVKETLKAFGDDSLTSWKNKAGQHFNSLQQTSVDQVRSRQPAKEPIPSKRPTRITPAPRPIPPQIPVPQPVLPKKSSLIGLEDLKQLLPLLSIEEIANTLIEYINQNELNLALEIITHIETTYQKPSDADKIESILVSIATRIKKHNNTFVRVTHGLRELTQNLHRKGLTPPTAPLKPLPVPPTAPKAPAVKPTAPAPIVSQIPLLTRDQLPVLTKEDLIREINKTKEILVRARVFTALTLSHHEKIMAIGDTHGGGDELIATINKMRQDNRFEPKNPWVLRDGYKLLFTGDIADRGPDGLICWQIVMNLIQNNPENCFALRGNHEARDIATNYGFLDQLLETYQGKYGENWIQIFDAFTTLFDTLPLVSFLGIRQINNTVIFGMYCHGGLDPRADTDDIKNMIKESTQQQGRLIGKALSEIRIHEDKIPWNDPFTLEINGYTWSDFNLLGGQKFAASPRRAGFEISPDYMSETFKLYSTPQFQVLYIARAHWHLSGVLNKFEIAVKDNQWKQLSAQEVIQPNSIYTFMSLSAQILTHDDKPPQAGYVLIESNGNNQLTITPYIAIDHSKR